MHLFYAPDINNVQYVLNPEDSRHCTKVLRLRGKDKISLTDGKGHFYHCTITKADSKSTEVKIDEDLLKTIAQSNGGKYFRATDNEKFQSIYEEIDALEKTEIEVKEYRKRKEEFYPYAAASGILLVLSFLVQHTTLKSIV